MMIVSEPPEYHPEDEHEPVVGYIAYSPTNGVMTTTSPTEAEAAGDWADREEMIHFDGQETPADVVIVPVHIHDDGAQQVEHLAATCLCGW
jgi:hypothetical protein